MYPDGLEFPDTDLEIWGREYPRRPGSKRPPDICIEIWNYAGLTGKQQRALVRTYLDRVESRRKAKITRLRRERLNDPDGAAHANPAVEWFGRTACAGSFITDDHECPTGFRWNDGEITLDFSSGVSCGATAHQGSEETALNRYSRHFEAVLPKSSPLYEDLLQKSKGKIGEDERTWSAISSPALPISSWPQLQHREKNVDISYPLWCAVARPVSMKERKANKDACERQRQHSP